MTATAFEEAVGRGLDRIPEDLRAAMANVAVVVDDEPPADEPDLLGLYEGVPLPARDGWWAAGSLPDRITIFRRPILQRCATVDEVVEQVAITVVHEVAHHFGIDDDRLRELGWD